MASPRDARSGERLASWLMLVVALLGAIYLGRRSLRSSPTSPDRVDPNAAVPVGPQLLITADIEALTDVARTQLLQAGAGSLLGLKELCGFEPLLAMRRIAIATPEGASDFAFIAETTLGSEQVLRCAERAITRRGGSPVRTRLGSFDSVRDGARPIGEVAIRADGLFVLSGAKYFRDVLDQAAGTLQPDDASRLRERIHAAVRERLGDGQVIISSVTTDPRAEPRGLRSMGAAVWVGQRTRIRAFAGCQDERACRDALEMAEALRSSLRSDALFAPLGSARLTMRGAELTAQAEIENEQLGPMLAKLLAW